MEENGSMRKSERPKDYNNVGASTKKSILKEKKAQVHSWWESSTSQEDFLVHDQFPWPPRSYTCTFCKRGFRSAQALGGHMNIHRREKARLRQVITPPKYLPFLPTTHLDQNPNRKYPKHLTKFTCSSSLAFSAPRFCKLCPLDTTNFTGVILQKSDLTVDEFSHGKESSMIVKKSDG